MTGKPIRQRPAATYDFDGIVDYYLAQAGIALATRFSEALNDALDLVCRNPGAGSGLIAERNGLPGLRGWPVSGFPYLICYFDRPDHVDVWRILHGARDLGPLLEDEVGPEG